MKSKINTHKLINEKLCGTPVLCTKNQAKVELKLTKEMAADEKGLIHGGFIFGLADYAAMLCVNHPLVVLSASSSKFLKPLKIGDLIIADAVVLKTDKNKIFVKVNVYSKDLLVFTGEFTTIIPKQHVLD
ncbi:MAG: PaaI family thioesterase [Desulforegulaceae bacterium]|nr:PaaI family thioesterase [Desulforegulaceae bacterium]